MILALVCGGGVGAGLWLFARGLLPARPSLAASLAALRQPVGPAPLLHPADFEGFLAHLGLPAGRVLARRTPRLLWPGLRRDLAVLGRSAERHLADKTVLGLLGLLLPAALSGVFAVEGIVVRVTVPVWASLLLAIGGFVLPDLGVHSDAQARRRDFRHALGAFLDLVVIALAGGSGVETALTDAAGVGTGWAYDQLRHALSAARLSRQPPWASLGQLGGELGIGELEELAASVGLAGTEGAKVRASLAAKAASLRAHALAEAETDGQAATERMSLPVVLLFAGFLLFIGFPAVTRVLIGL